MIILGVQISIDMQTQAFLREFARLYTSADLKALADLKAGMDRTKAKLDAIDPHSQQTGASS